MNTHKTILIIGGMGPQASLLLHKMIIDAAICQGATEGSDFPEILHLSLPVSDFMSDETKKHAALEIILQRLERLWRYLFYAHRFSM